jgi:hypothetical protein
VTEFPKKVIERSRNALFWGFGVGRFGLRFLESGVSAPLNDRLRLRSVTEFPKKVIERSRNALFWGFGDEVSSYGFWSRALRLRSVTGIGLRSVTDLGTAKQPTFHKKGSDRFFPHNVIERSRNALEGNEIPLRN